MKDFSTVKWCFADNHIIAFCFL